MIAILDYGMGNLRSVEKALQHLGFGAETTSCSERIRAADRLILPGVGAFGSAMERLDRRREDGTSLRELVLEALEEGRPLLGICLGMQLLFEKSSELGEHEGLGLLAGRVEKIDTHGDSSLKIPHMGWNLLRFPRPGVLTAGLPPQSYVYFVHSYHVLPSGDSPVVAMTEHGGPICAAVEQGLVMGVQFHPEKSSDTGLRMLRNWAEWQPA